MSAVVAVRLCLMMARSSLRQAVEVVPMVFVRPPVEAQISAPMAVVEPALVPGLVEQMAPLVAGLPLEAMAVVEWVSLETDKAAVAAALVMSVPLLLAVQEYWIAARRVVSVAAEVLLGAITSVLAAAVGVATRVAVAAQRVQAYGMEAEAVGVEAVLAAQP